MSCSLCDGKCSGCELVTADNFSTVLKIFSEVDQDDLPIIGKFCPTILKKFQDYWVNTAFPKGILFERNSLPCEGDCEKCSLISSKNSKVLSAVLNALHEASNGILPTVNGHCPNLTVCPACSIDDFCHADDCPVCSVIDEEVYQED